MVPLFSLSGCFSFRFFFFLPWLLFILDSLPFSPRSFPQPCRLNYCIPSLPTKDHAEAAPLLTCLVDRVFGSSLFFPSGFPPLFSSLVVVVCFSTHHPVSLKYVPSSRAKSSGRLSTHPPFYNASESLCSGMLDIPWSRPPPVKPYLSVSYCP